MGGFEVTDVLADGFGEFALVAAGLDVLAFQSAHVVLVEDGPHGLDLLERGRDWLDVVVPVEDAGLDCGFVGGVGDRVPGAEDQLVETRQRHEVADERGAVIGALAEADRAHLRQRPDRFG